MELKKTLYSLMLGGILLCLFSCAKENKLEMSTLVFSKSSIAFDKGVSERNISVTISQNSWIASSLQKDDWLSLVQDGNILKAKVTKNKIGTERTSHVPANANGASGKIAVTQSVVDVTLDVVSNAIYLPQTGGGKTINITTSSSVYDVTTSEEVSWLKIVRSEEKIKLIAKRDDIYQGHEVKFYAKGDSVIREIVISQLGIQRYLLPIYSGVPQDEHKIMDSGLGRGSYLREYQTAMPAYGLEETYIFIVPPPIFTLIQYCGTDSINPSQIIMIGNGRKAIGAVKDKAFYKFLTDNGYVRSNSQSDREYINDKDLLSLKVYVSEKKNNEGVNLIFTLAIKRNGDYKTFSKLPFYPLELLQKDNVKLARIEQYEQKTGSTEEERSLNEYKNTEVSQIQYKLKASTNPSVAYGCIHILYTTDKNGDASDNLGSVQIGALLFKDINLGAWRHGTKWVATKEIKKVLGDEGSPFPRTSDNNHFFVCESDYLIINITCVLGNNSLVLASLYSYDPSVSGTSSKAVKVQAKMIRSSAATKKALKL